MLWNVDVKPQPPESSKMHVFGATFCPAKRRSHIQIHTHTHSFSLSLSRLYITHIAHTLFFFVSFNLLKWIEGKRMPSTKECVCVFVCWGVHNNKSTLEILHAYEITDVTHLKWLAHVEVVMLLLFLVFRVCALFSLCTLEMKVELLCIGWPSPCLHLVCMAQKCVETIKAHNFDQKSFMLKLCYKIHASYW